MNILFLVIAVLLLGLCSHAIAEGLTWVENGQPRAAVIVPDDALPIADYAAQELVEHVRLATGATLPVVSEGQAGGVAGGRIYVGDTRAAKDAGIDVSTLGDEVFVLRGGKGALYIAGRDGKGHPLNFNNPDSGTLWGVYEVLERVLKVRWLWPGELGTVVPRVATVRSPDFDETVPPRFHLRRIRLYDRWEGDSVSVALTEQRDAQAKGIAFSEEGYQRYLHDQLVFMRRHRMGNTSREVSTQHGFEGWWERYGKEHPEWFQQLPEGDMLDEWRRRFGSMWGLPLDKAHGQRGPADLESPNLVSMCVSNKELQREIVRRWQEERAKNPGKFVPLQLGENDISAYCTCDACRALDDLQPGEAEMAAMPPSVRGMYEPMNVARRYTMFWKSVYDMAAEIDPDVVITALVYLNYFVCPDDVTLNKNTVLPFVPWGGWWFPRDPREQEWVRDQWRKWQRTGATLVYRPNYTWNGASMPHVYAHQMADIYQFTLRHGADGFDFDMLNGQWAVNGTTLYLLHRLHEHPEMGVEELLEEYYLAFGPAAPHVKAYFDYWEVHTTANGLIAGEVMGRNKANNLHTYLRAAHDFYPPESFDRAEAILNKARDAVEGNADPLYARRVDFLAKGLAHARMTARLSALFAEKADPERIRQLVEELVAFRRETEGLCIADFTKAGGDELKSFGDGFDFTVKTMPYKPVEMKWEK